MEVLARVEKSTTLRRARFVGIMFKEPDELGNRQAKVIVNNRRTVVSRKIYRAGKADHEYTVGVILDREQQRVDAFCHREFRDGEDDPLHLQTR